MSWIPLIRYDDETETLLFTIQQRWWEPEEGVGFGDEDESDAGVPHSYVVRYDRAVRVVIRFTDDEYEDVMAAMKWIMEHKSEGFYYRFDQLDAATDFFVYLESPRLGERIRPTRDGSAPWTWTLSLLLRSTSGERIHVPGALG